MILTKILLHSGHHGADKFEYINLDSIVEVDVYATHYLVIMANGSTHHTDLTDVTISTKVADADTAYVPPS